MFVTLPNIVETLLDSLRNEFQYGSFTFTGPPFCLPAVVAKHFCKSSEKVYGVYVIRQQDAREILYIGKRGTINAQGQYRSQDVPGRMCAPHGTDLSGKNISADEWFRHLVDDMGPIEVEYVRLPPRNKSF